MNSTKQWLDFLLADIATKIQLSPTDYELAKERYRAISEWVSSEGSQIARFNPYIYPQGSFRTQSTISANADQDEFDIDLMLELEIPHDSDPYKVLKMVADSIDRGPGTRYHEKVDMKKRCVRVQYENMHLDLTPSVLLNSSNPRESTIFDRHPNRKRHVIANPEGFAQWFDEKVLPQALLLERAMRLAKAADAEPVPDQKPIEQKPLKLIVLQLIKRYRDIRYTPAPWEKPPSVLTAKLVADAPVLSNSLTDALSAVVNYMIVTLSGELLHVENPRCSRDILTDRWPLNLQKQQVFLGHLRELKNALIHLQGESNLDAKRKILAALFGERVTDKSFVALNEYMARQSGSGNVRYGTVLGGIYPVTQDNVIPGTREIKAHKFYGIPYKPSKK
ncbi:MAG: nucleotidyltransferase [Alphaproteobacteria bacterium PRO2]|nr:nucleotidyltransferase [Alphaproteobacteria bacterium PRO2]